MTNISKNTFATQSQLTVDDREYRIFNPKKLTGPGFENVSRLPKSLRVLLENLLRFEDNNTVTQDDIKALVSIGLRKNNEEREIAYRPARVLMQDFTGVPAVVDLAAMRDAVARSGGDPKVINPLCNVDLVIDHSVMVDHFAYPGAFDDNVALEMQRNNERYEFLRWGQQAFQNFRVVPPGTGICHQVNLEYLAKAVWKKQEGGQWEAFPDTLVGTDSHTTMINGLGVLGWGVGGIEAESAMLGQPISMLVPDVVGFKLIGQLKEGVTATDLVLTVVQMLRKHGVVGKFVEFFGNALPHLSLSDRALIANMAPEYGATCGFFPIDGETLGYLRLTGRDEHDVRLVEAYAKETGFWNDESAEDTIFASCLELDISTVEPCLAGPKRPQDRVALAAMKKKAEEILALSGRQTPEAVPVQDTNYSLKDGDVVIAAITSCTNTSNPAVMLAAGLVARKALEKGLQRKPWVKSSLSPGSKVVSEYFDHTGLQKDLNALGFHITGYGCMTCIGNSGPLPGAIEEAVIRGDLNVSAVLSGNRNFEGRIHQNVKSNWLASPPLVVAYALAGTTLIDLTKDPIGQNAKGESIYLKDIWPTQQEVRDVVSQVSLSMFQRQYSNVFAGTKEWQEIPVSPAQTYTWKSESTYIQHPTFFEKAFSGAPTEIRSARILALLGDSVTTDHISPAGNIEEDSPAGKYLTDNGVSVEDFNSYGSRRGNHEVMMRGTFANVRIKNQMVKGVEGGYTKHIPTGETLAIYDAAMKYQSEGTPLVVFGGKEYGTGSSRDWAAKGTRLLGVKAVICESFERIHRSNLIGMGVMPLQFVQGDWNSLDLTGAETIDILGDWQNLEPKQTFTMVIHRVDGSTLNVDLQSRLDTSNEVSYIQAGGILHYVLKQLASPTKH
ncbi:MAG: aconitate hydratase AcnA [Pseudomonadota bacterium]